jgi:imidazole glycerol-phosphate synthase subunit HisF
MLRKRIIFSLIYGDGKFNQSRNFRLQEVGDINWLERNYKFQEIAFALDELIVLNASKKKKDIKSFSKVLNRLVNDVFIPIAAGGGIRSMKDAELLFHNGADKLVLNSVLYTDKELVKKLVKKYGSQSIVGSIDYALSNVYISDGLKKIDLPLGKYIDYVTSLGVGEIYLNSIDKDGTGFGYDFETICLVSKNIKLPLIIAGGAGNDRHLIEGLRTDNVSAVATANLFNFVGNGLPEARKRILEEGINIVSWSEVVE